MMSGTLETLIRRDRFWVMTGIVGTTALAWVYLVGMAASMDGMDAMVMVRTTPWTSTDFLLMFLMWAVMMVGMMLPSARSHDPPVCPR